MVLRGRIRFEEVKGFSTVSVGPFLKPALQLIITPSPYPVTKRYAQGMSPARGDFQPGADARRFDVLVPKIVYPVSMFPKIALFAEVPLDTCARMIKQGGLKQDRRVLCQQLPQQTHG